MKNCIRLHSCLVIIGIGVSSFGFSQPNITKQKDIKVDNLINTNDYWTTVIAISGPVFDLNKKWVAPSGNGITEFGSWISPKASALSLFSSILFGFANQSALERNYQNSLKSLIEISNKNLKAGVGQLFRFTYNSDEFGGVADVNSVRFTAMGFGSTPELSLASGPIDQISSYYEGSMAFPKRTSLYVYIRKDKQNRLIVSTIKEPFIDAFNQRANELRIKLLESSEPSITFNDANIRRFNNIQLWQGHLESQRNELKRVDRQGQIDKLNFLFSKKQQEFDILYIDFLQSAASKEGLNNLFHFMDACETLIGSVSKIAADEQTKLTKNEREAGNLLFQGLTQEITTQKIELNLLRTEILGIDGQMRKFFKLKKIQEPSLIQLPRLD